MASNYNYHSTTEGAAPTSPYAGGQNPGSSGYIATGPPKKGVSNWVKFGIPVAVIVIVGAVLGGVLGSRASKHDSSSSSSSSGNTSGGSPNPSSVISVKNDVGRFATATDSDYFMPVYPSTVSSFQFFSSITS